MCFSASSSRRGRAMVGRTNLTGTNIATIIASLSSYKRELG